MAIVVATDFGHISGGAGKVALESAKGLAGRGHEVVLFTAIGPIAPDLLDVPHLRHEALQQPNIWDDHNPLAAATRGIWNLTAAQRLRSLLRGLDPHDTVVHLHSWSKALSPSVVHAARSAGVPILMTLHDYFSVCPTGTLFNHRKAAACPLIPLSASCVLSNCDARSYAHKIWRLGRHAAQSIAGLPDGIDDLIAVSESSARVFRRLLPATVRLHHVPNFVEVPRESPVNVADNQAIVYVGRLSPEKGPMLLGACAERVQAPVVFVGDGPQAAEVRARYPTAHVTGWQSADGVHRSLRAHVRALVLPSLWNETQGLVVAEAAALGVPAIVPDASGASDWVEDGVTGLWFRSGDEADLSRKMAALMNDPALARRMGQAAYDEFWSSPPTLDTHLDRLEGLYRTAIQRAWSRTAVQASDPDAVREIR